MNTHHHHRPPRIHRTNIAFAIATRSRAAIAMITQLQKQYAALLYDAGKAATAKKLEESNNGSSLFKFDCPPPPTDMDYNSVRSDDSVDVDAPFVDQLNNESSRVWTIPECRPKQIMAVETVSLRRSVSLIS